MTSAVQSSLESAASIKATLSALTVLALTDYNFPPDTPTSSLLSIYDHVVIGGGSAGCIVASRLSEDPSKTVLLVEAGYVPPLESMLPGLFPYLPKTKSDWNQTSSPDNHATQNLVDTIAEMTKGQMLGGSSGVDHMMYIRASRDDFDIWANIVGDDAWNYDNLFPYLIKPENMLDEEILENYSAYHGTSGPIKLKRQVNPYNVPILDAFKEQGHDILIDINVENTVGIYEPLYMIADGVRYSSSKGYFLTDPNRKNLHVKYNTLGTKVIFDSNNVATGVEILDSDNVALTIQSRKEIVLSAGAINTPVILSHSGVGVKEQLDNLEIDIVSELPVGQNLVDHCGVMTVFPLGKINITAENNYHKFPMPVTIGSVSLNSSDYPDYQTVNLLFPQNSSGFLMFCSSVFTYTEEICEEIHEVNLENDLFVSVIYILHPYSRGQVITNSADPKDYPTVELGLLSDERDVDTLARAIMDFNTIVNTSYFQSANSTMLNINLTKCNDLDKESYEYYKCYALEMSSTMWHYCSTCPIGTVLNSDLTVKNTTNLLVIDAAAMPYTISGKPLGALRALAEKGSDIIINNSENNQR